MKMHKIESAFIQEAGYEEEAEVMKIVFGNGKSFDILNVPVEVFEEFLNAESQGKFYHKEIKNKFTHREA